MKTIDEDIRNGQYKTMYLLYGDEAYLKKQYKDKFMVEFPDYQGNFFIFDDCTSKNK